MKVFERLTDPELADLLTQGAIGILKTDTLYGVVAAAADEAAVRRVYTLKDRTETKSPIVLIASVDQLFDRLPASYATLIKDGWPEKTSIIIPSSQAPAWIQRGNKSVAYRVPADEPLRALLRATGPLIAPSANPEGQPPALSYDEAYEYFGEAVDFYVDQGLVSDDTPSRLLTLNAHGEIERLR